MTREQKAAYFTQLGAQIEGITERLTTLYQSDEYKNLSAPSSAEDELAALIADMRGR